MQVTCESLATATFPGQLQLCLRVVAAALKKMLACHRASLFTPRQHHRSSPRMLCATSGQQAELSTSSSERSTEVMVLFKTEGVSCNAAPGEVIWEVAQRCGVDIQTGCHQGNCGVCEVRIVAGEANLQPPSARQPMHDAPCIATAFAWSPIHVPRSHPSW